MALSLLEIPQHRLPPSIGYAFYIFPLLLPIASTRGLSLLPHCLFCSLQPNPSTILYTSPPRVLSRNAVLPWHRAVDCGSV